MYIIYYCTFYIKEKVSNKQKRAIIYINNQ